MQILLFVDTFSSGDKHERMTEKRSSNTLKLDYFFMLKQLMYLNNGFLIFTLLFTTVQINIEISKNLREGGGHTMILDINRIIAANTKNKN